MADRADPLPTRRLRARPKALMAAAAVIGAFLFVLCIPFALSSNVSKNRLRTLFVEKVHETSGLSAEVSGDATLVFWPKPHIALSNVDMRDESSAIRLHAGSVRVDLSLIPLLWNTLDVAAIRLDKPILDLDLDHPAHVTAGVLSRPAGPTDHAFGLVQIDGGDVILKRHERPDIKLKAVDATIDWRTVQASASVTATFVFEGRPEKLDGWLGAPARLLGGDGSQLLVRLDGSALRARLNGTLDMHDGVHFAGHSTAETPELQLLLRSLGLGHADMPDLGRCRMDADLAIDKVGATLSALRLHVASNDFEGSLAVGLGTGKPSLAGTLAVATLDLGPLIATFPPIRDTDGGWSSHPLDFSGLDIVDADLRISTSRTRVAHTDIVDAALSVMISSGALELNLAEGRIDNGAAKGRLTVAPHDAGADVQASGSFAGADFIDLLPSSVSTGLAGRLAGTFSVATTGSNFADLIAAAHGRSDFTVHNGRVGGIDLEQNLRRLDKGDGSARVRFGGTTSFDLAHFGIDLAEGTARFDDAAFVGPGARMAINGTVDLPRRAIDLGGLATRAGTDGTAIADGPQLSIRLAGPWTSPLFEATPIVNHANGEGAP